jgi:glycosyltransferase involved in cell wall biosynthesis
VEPGKFILFVGRLVPENNAHLLVEAYGMLDTDWPLVIVGDAPYAEDYIAQLKASAGPNVRFPGYVFGEGYAELVHRCGIMCVPTEVGGTHPVIVEAMAAGACLLVSDHPPNVEVVGDTAAAFSLEGRAGSLAATLEELLRGGPHREDLRRAAELRAAERHGWRECASRHLALCAQVRAS